MRILVLPGDGIGPEICKATIKVLEAAVAPLNIPISPSGCSCPCPVEGPTMMGNFSFTPSSSDDRSSRHVRGGE